MTTTATNPNPLLPVPRPRPDDPLYPHTLFLFKKPLEIKDGAWLHDEGQMLDMYLLAIHHIQGASLHMARILYHMPAHTLPYDLSHNDLSHFVEKYYAHAVAQEESNRIALVEQHAELVKRVREMFVNHLNNGHGYTHAHPDLYAEARKALKASLTPAQWINMRHFIAEKALKRKPSLSAFETVFQHNEMLYCRNNLTYYDIKSLENLTLLFMGHINQAMADIRAMEEMARRRCVTFIPEDDKNYRILRAAGMERMLDPQYVARLLRNYTYR
jgi:hypothetical protein